MSFAVCHFCADITECNYLPSYTSAKLIPDLWDLVCVIGGMNLSLKIGGVSNKIQMSE